MNNVDISLKKYIEDNIFPLYEDNIGGHGIEHIESVINRSFELIKEFNLDVDSNMVYVIAAFHDIGYKTNPKEHEEVSSEMFLNNEEMKKYFNEDEIKTIAEAIVDHRASLEYEARSIYGKIVSSADREIYASRVFKRSLLFQKDKLKDKDHDIMDVIENSYQKLFSKYGKDGYAKMYFPDKKYNDFLSEMHDILNDKDKFINIEKQIIEELNIK